MAYIQSAVGYDVLKWNLSISENKGASSGKSGKSEVRELHFQRGPLSFSVAPSHEGRAHQMLMQVNNYSMPYLPFLLSICTCVLLVVRYSKHTGSYSITEDLYFNFVVSALKLLHPFNGLCSRSTCVSRCQKGKPLLI